MSEHPLRALTGPLSCGFLIVLAGLFSAYVSRLWGASFMYCFRNARSMRRTIRAGEKLKPQSILEDGSESRKKPQNSARLTR